MSRSILTATCAGMLMIALPASAQDTGTPTPETLSGAYTGKACSVTACRLARRTGLRVAVLISLSLQVVN